MQLFAFGVVKGVVLMRKNPVFDMAVCGIMTAMFCLSAVFAVPMPMTPVPVTLQTFFVCVFAALLKRRQSVTVIFAYLLLGIAGLPVFSGMRSGVGVLAGPTGGFLLGFIPAAYTISTLFRVLYGARKLPPVLSLAIPFVAGGLVIYTFGTAQLMVVNSLSPQAAFVAGALPFIAIDFAKITVAVLTILPFYGKISVIRSDL